MKKKITKKDQEAIKKIMTRKLIAPTKFKKDTMLLIHPIVGFISQEQLDGFQKKVGQLMHEYKIMEFTARFLKMPPRDIIQGDATLKL